MGSGSNFFTETREAHVGQQAISVLVNDDVLGLDVSMQDAAAVHVLNGKYDLRDDEPGYRGGETKIVA
jgi:hypothetical protein